MMNWKQKITSLCIAIAFIVACNLVVWTIINFITPINNIDDGVRLFMMILSSMPFSFGYFFYIEERLFKDKLKGKQ